MNFYNDNARFCADWLRNLIAAGGLADGTVDERCITEIQADELRDARQVHLFAGIGGWPYALRLADWPDELPVWTGSCPCQPLSCAGKRRGASDERHLWPEMFRLIRECRPPIVFGEQVGGRLGREWLAGVRADLEAAAYAVGAADLCAAGVGAPHIRQRLFWVAYAGSEPRCQPDGHDAERRRPKHPEQIGLGGEPGGLADADGGDASDGRIQRGRQHGQQSENSGPSNGMADAEGGGTGAIQQPRRVRSALIESPWSASVLVDCADGKARRVEPGICPLADGVPGRVGCLRAHGNAIVPQVAAAFVRGVMEIIL